MSNPKIPVWGWVLAETGIVVVGILIAFGLNSWWEGRASVDRERAHLTALHSDFERNVERLDALARTQDRVSRASGDLLLIARGHGSAPPDSVDRLMGEVFNSDQFDPVMGAYENLVNSGGLAQIRDPDLRAALASFAAMVDSRYWEEFSTALYLDFNREFMGRLGWAEIILRHELGIGGEASPGPRTSWNHEILADPVFQDHLGFRFFSQRDVAGMYRTLAGQAGLVLERIEALLR
jgi:hypothetical protein